MARFSGKTIVITGASSGIGQATAEAFAREGARLVLASRGRQSLEQVAARCRTIGRSSGGDAIAVPTDVSDHDAVRKLAERAQVFSGKIDIWFSNVGVGAIGPFHEVPAEVHAQVVKSSLIGHMNDAHAVVPVFLRQGHGIFINMASLGAFAAAPYAASYSAAKFGLRGFSAALRAELAGYPHIHVCDVYPGFVDTPAVPNAANYTGRKLSVPPPVLDPRRVASAILSLASRPRNSITIGSTAHLVRLGQVLVPQAVLNLVAAYMRHSFAKSPRIGMDSGIVMQPPPRGAGIEGGLRTGSGARGPALAGLAAVAGLAVLAALGAARRG